MNLQALDQLGIKRLATDSRRVARGDTFVAYPGEAQDGRRFIAQAIVHGAASVLWEKRGFRWHPEWRVANAGIAHLRARAGIIAHRVYGEPSARLWMIGVTGTNGKTSCAHWIGHAFDACGRRAGILGTLGNGLIGGLAPATHTTPDAPALHELLHQFKAAGAKAVTMEVSSHGLDQGRVSGIKFDIALFTNLTRDHLDYHHTMAAYGQAKAKLFSWPGLRTVVINADDPFGQSLIDAARNRGTRLLTYGLASADIAATEIRMTGNGIALSVNTPWGNADFASMMVGTFNAQNLLGVLGVLLASDIPLDTATAAIARLQPPPGRMQRLGGTDRPLVVVDYAHTPDALEKVLTALRPAVTAPGELICVFGCGGDRDAGKRPEMGHIAARIADRVVVTSDNPRSEDPSAIANAIARGVRDEGNRRWTIEIDRADAIRNAIGAARTGDVVLIAGKGHETYQEYQGVRTPFSDAALAAAALSTWNIA
jgi:UDP-N-acetylmuramyl-tripeptide synthetase